MSFEEEAEKHWDWLAELLHEVYVGAMVHGYKHGLEDGKNEQVREVFGSTAQRATS